LPENTQIHHNLERSANEKLRWCVSDKEVGSFEDVSAGPHEHHYHAHSIRRPFHPVSVELGNAKCRFCKYGCKTKSFHKRSKVNEEIHEHRPQGPDSHDAFDIRCKIRPLPEVLWVEISKNVLLLYFGNYVLFGVDGHTELNNGKHGDVHEYTLDEEGRLVVVAEPEKYSECIGHEKGQADVDGEALRRLLLLDLNEGYRAQRRRISSLADIRLLRSV